MQESETQKTLHGIKWSYISTISMAVMQIGYTEVTAHPLNHSDFGLLAMSGCCISKMNYKENYHFIN